MKFSDLYKTIFHHKRTILLTALAVLSAVSILSVGPTYAYLKMEALPAQNSFSAAPQPSGMTILESFSGGSEKSNVKIAVGDTGGYSVYVRAVAVVTWKNGSDVLGTAPVAGTDYSISYGSGWSRDSSDGYYYYSQPVVSNGETDVFISSCRALRPAPEEGYTLSVEIMAQTIQYAGKTESGDSAAMDAWGHNFA